MRSTCRYSKVDHGNTSNTNSSCVNGENGGISGKDGPCINLRLATTWWSKYHHSSDWRVCVCQQVGAVSRSKNVSNANQNTSSTTVFGSIVHAVTENSNLVGKKTHPKQRQRHVDTTAAPTPVSSLS